MLEHSLLKAKRFPLCLITLCSVALASSEHALSLDLNDQSSIVTSYMQVKTEDKKLAASFAKQAQELMKNNRSANNNGPLVKLWCESVMAAPNPKNLAECAKVRFESVSYMSNPQPSKVAVQTHQAKKSLTMIRAALEIAGGETQVQDSLRERLISDYQYYRHFISNNNE